MQTAHANTRLVIIGAGHAGGLAAVYARQYGFPGSITLLGEEAMPPYQRPPLSKEYLKGESTASNWRAPPHFIDRDSRVESRDAL